MRRSVLWLVLALVIAACGGDNGPDPIQVEGTWSGTFKSGSLTGAVAMTLVEEDGDVSGDGTIGSADDALAVTLSGTFSEPNVSLTVSAPGFEDMNLSGTVGETKLTGTLNGSGFTNATVTLTRK
jgi:hypothetical protein